MYIYIYKVTHRHELLYWTELCSNFACIYGSDHMASVFRKNGSRGDLMKVDLFIYRASIDVPVFP